MENMEATQAKLELSYDEALMDFDCDKDKNIANKKDPPAFLFNNEQVTAKSYSVHENTILCLKDFDTVLNNVREQNPRINSSTSNVGGVEGSSLETLCDDIDQASASIETWKNIYENFAQINECKNIYSNTDDGLDGISKIGDNKTYLSNDIQIVSEKKYIVPIDTAQIVETQPNYNNDNTQIIENNSTKVYRDFENVSKKPRKKRHINGKSICKKVSSKSITRKRINKSINLKKQNVVSSQTKSQSYNIESENISISHDDDENLRSNGNILENEIPDIISISSDESIENIEFDSDGYKSSDFEFINETEAAKDIPQFDDFEELLTNTSDDEQSADVKELYQEDMIINDYFESLYPIIDTNKSDVNYRENHTIPVGEDFLNLFIGNYTPYPMYSFENKLTSSTAGMNVERVGFNLDMVEVDSTPEQRSEVRETERKILSMYYAENRSRRQIRRNFKNAI